MVPTRAVTSRSRKGDGHSHGLSLHVIQNQAEDPPRNSLRTNVVGTEFQFMPLCPDVSMWSLQRRLVV